MKTDQIRRIIDGRVRVERTSITDDLSYTFDNVRNACIEIIDAYIDNELDDAGEREADIFQACTTADIVAWMTIRGAIVAMRETPTA